MSKLNIKNIRYFNNIHIVDNGKNIIKSYIGEDKYYKNKFYDEIVWMLKSQHLIPNNIPKIHDFSLSYDNLWIKYEMIEYNTLHDLFIQGKKIEWNQVVEAYQKFINDCKKIKPKFFIKEDWFNKAIDFYLDRTYDNLMRIKDKEKLKGFFEYNYVLINNKEYPSMKLILNLLMDKITKLRENSLKESDIFYQLVNIDQERIFLAHLDLIFGNVFFDDKSKKIKVIDPRGSFADSKDYGDIYYDYAKIYQSIYGLYDFMVEDQFNIEKTEENHFYLKINETKNLKLIREAFNKLLPKKEINIIKLLESLQFFAMTPAHSDNINRQIVQLCTGIKHLYETLDVNIWEK